jgi:hypothetical protein
MSGRSKGGPNKNSVLLSVVEWFFAYFTIRLYFNIALVSVAARSKAWVLAALLVRSWFRNPLEAWTFVFVLSCVGRGLCDGLITRPKESYQVS